MAIIRKENTSTGSTWRIHEGVLHLYRSERARVCDQKIFDRGEIQGLSEFVAGTDICMLCVDKAMTGDFIAKRWNRGTIGSTHREYELPMVMACRGCTGNGSFFWNGIAVHKPMAAFTIATLHYAKRMSDWDNQPPHNICTCATRQKELDHVRVFLEQAISDSGWICNSRSNCYSTYRRSIRINKDATIPSIKDITTYLHIDPACPGWTGVSADRLQPRSGVKDQILLTFTTSYDSGD